MRIVWGWTWIGLGLWLASGGTVTAQDTGPVDGVLDTGMTTAGSPSGGDDEVLDPLCPGAALQTIQATVSAHGHIECSVDFSISAGGVTYQTNQQGCPAVMIIHPSHDRLVAAPGSGMRGRSMGFVEAIAIEYQCLRQSFIFIEWDHRCAPMRERVAGQVATFTLAPCEGG